MGILNFVGNFLSSTPIIGHTIAIGAAMTGNDRLAKKAFINSTISTGIGLLTGPVGFATAASVKGATTVGTQLAASTIAAISTASGLATHETIKNSDTYKRVNDMNRRGGRNSDDNTSYRGSGTSSTSNTNGNTGKSTSGSGGNGNDPKKYRPNSHRDDIWDYDDELIYDGGPITNVVTGTGGSVQKLSARIEYRHLVIQKKNLLKDQSADSSSEDESTRRPVTARVKKFIDNLGFTRNHRDYVHANTREADEVGHIIAHRLGGPHNRTYNFFPQAPFANLDYYHTIEEKIYEHLLENENRGCVVFDIEFKYADYATDFPYRPREFKVVVKFLVNSITERIIEYTFRNF